jgi:predicted phosphodiesterase
VKLAIISDLHLDIHPSKNYVKLAKDLPEADVLAIAGDMCSFNNPKGYGRAEKFLKAVSPKYKKILYVTGNHDYWGTSLDKGNALIDSLTNIVPNFLRLHADNEFIYEDCKFVGDTLWFKEPETAPFKAAANYWIDYAKINCTFGDFQKLSDKFLNKLKNLPNGIETDSQKLVVITHHMPSPRCVAPMWANYDSNAFFVNDVSEYIFQNAPDFWIFGHTHNPFDFELNLTRMYANPRGYPGEGYNDNFLDRMVVEL